jgi:hypothetical protein
LKAFGRKRHRAAAFAASFWSPTTTNCSTSTGMSAVFFPASFAPASHSDLKRCQVSGSLTNPSPCNPASRIDFSPLAAAKIGIDWSGGS